MMSSPVRPDLTPAGFGLPPVPPRPDVAPQPPRRGWSAGRRRLVAGLVVLVDRRSGGDRDRGVQRPPARRVRVPADAPVPAQRAVPVEPVRTDPVSGEHRERAGRRGGRRRRRDRARHRGDRRPVPVRRDDEPDGEPTGGRPLLLGHRARHLRSGPRLVAPAPAVPGDRPRTGRAGVHARRPRERRADQPAMDERDRGRRRRRSVRTLRAVLGAVSPPARVRPRHGTRPRGGAERADVLDRRRQGHGPVSDG